eukprot:gene7859-10668_t
MTGNMRLQNVIELLQSAFEDGIEGDYIETGVWRGGLSILARGVMRAHNQGYRTSYVCDSFSGLPPSDHSKFGKDETVDFDHVPYLEVHDELVADNFHQLNLLDSNTVFVILGFFNNTLPVLRNQIKKLAVLRFDGDMYQSAVDVLYNLYDKVSVGGYVIIDDWFGFASRTACEHFFEVHHIKPVIKEIDSLSVYWKKTSDVQVEYWRYTHNKYRASDEKPK